MRPSATISLHSMRKDEEGRIVEIEGGEIFKSKLKAMGIYPGQQIKKISKARLHGPNRVEVMGSELALGAGISQYIKVRVKAYKVLLAGNPNVGKSVVFSRLTGINVISSNYPGTTVEYMSGNTMIAGERFTIIDVPGAYSSQGLNKAEEAAAKIIKETSDRALILNVVDATNLERNLYYTLELTALKTPMVIILNKWDIAKRLGIIIDTKMLEQKLGVKVIPFVATTSEGMVELTRTVADFLDNGLPAPATVPESSDDRWKLIGRISADCQKITHKHANLIEKFQDLTSRQSTGLPFAVIVLTASFFVIRFIGENLISYVLEPIFNHIWFPIVTYLVSGMSDGNFLKILLYGSSQTPLNSFGLLITGVYIPFVTVLPYIVAFYAILSLLEDSGYLPRLAVLLDTFMHRLGLHGYSVIPLILGFGCKVPAIFATRVLETRREQIIATTLALAIAPCIPQTAMIISLLSPYAFKYTLITFLAILTSGLTASYFLSHILKGDTPELFVEIPPYQIPAFNILAKKIWFRIKDFLFEAVPMIALGVLIINILDYAGFFELITPLFGPIMQGAFNLPTETVSVVLLGFLRKDVSISMLAPFNLSPEQIAVASLFLTLYLPCIATFMVVVKELKFKNAWIVFSSNFIIACVFAFALNLVWKLL